MSIEGVDYSTARPSPAGLYAAGKRFAVRYGGAGTDDKHLHPAEADALAAAGLSIVANVEGSQGGMLGGYSVGADWARTADAAFRACGMPAGRPIYLSCDFDVTALQWHLIAAALDGAASALGRGRVGIYGGRNAVAWARRDGKAFWFWQTYAWSGGVWVSGNHIQQYRNGVQVAGGDCDLDQALTADFGQWTPGINVGGTEVAVQEVITTGPKAGTTLGDAASYSWGGIENVTGTINTIRAAVDQLKAADVSQSTTLATLLGLLNAATSGGGTIDTAAVTAAIAAEHETTRALLVDQHAQEMAALKAERDAELAALKAELAALTAAA